MASWARSSRRARGRKDEKEEEMSRRMEGRVELSLRFELLSCVEEGEPLPPWIPSISADKGISLLLCPQAVCGQCCAIQR
jgi:hypothetical protein